MAIGLLLAEERRSPAGAADRTLRATDPSVLKRETLDLAQIAGSDRGIRAPSR